MDDKVVKIELKSIAVHADQENPYPDIETAEERELKAEIGEQLTEKMVKDARRYVDHLLRASMIPQDLREAYALAEKLSILTEEPVKSILERAVGIDADDHSGLCRLLESWIETAARGDVIALPAANPFVFQPLPREISRRGRPDAQQPKERKTTNREKRIARARRAKGRRK